MRGHHTGAWGGLEFLVSFMGPRWAAGRADHVAATPPPLPPEHWPSPGPSGAGRVLEKWVSSLMSSRIVIGGFERLCNVSSPEVKVCQCVGVRLWLQHLVPWAGRQASLDMPCSRDRGGISPGVK